MDSYGVTFAIIVLGMLFIGTGFTKRDRRSACSSCGSG